MKKVIIFLLLSTLFSCTYESTTITTKETTTTITYPAPKYKETIIVYMAADNNLSDVAFPNIREMIRGLKEDANLVVFLDYRNYQRRKSYLYNFNNPNITDLSEHIVKEYEDFNSTSPTKFQEILNEVIEKYPSESYGLILWSHADGWRPRIRSTRKSFGDDHGMAMNIDELHQSLESVLDNNEIEKFNFILFDACLMGGVEIVSELKEVSEYIVASPAEVPEKGFPYTTTFAALTNYSEPKEVRLENACRAFMTYYSNLDDGDRTGTIALYKTSYMAQLEHKMKEVIQHYDLTSKRVYSDNLQRLSLDEDYFDFMDMIEQHFTTSEQQQIGEIVEKLILYKGNTPTLFYDEIVLDKYCGITIYVPTREKYLLAPRFYGSQWAKNSFYQKLIENTFNVYQN
ncbi:MAG: clostripain-related cysteine peptidase [Prolixibacteraceae bacterium]|jgi:hypothetical protein|nr:clostripain-related cysteine peptidase [Prolixibacteraceae bacterium]